MADDDRQHFMGAPVGSEPDPMKPTEFISMPVPAQRTDKQTAGPPPPSARPPSFEQPPQPPSQAQRSGMASAEVRMDQAGATPFDGYGVSAQTSYVRMAHSRRRFRGVMIALFLMVAALVTLGVLILAVVM